MTGKMTATFHGGEDKGSSEAWAFMRECDERDIMAGFPVAHFDSRGYAHGEITHYTVSYVPTVPRGWELL